MIKLNYKIGILLFIIAGIFLINSASAGITNINECQNLTIANEIYNLTSNIISNFTCFNVLNSSITLDANGNTITYGLNNTVSYGLLVASGKGNITILNGNWISGTVGVNGCTCG